MHALLLVVPSQTLVTRSFLRGGQLGAELLLGNERQLRRVRASAPSIGSLFSLIKAYLVQRLNQAQLRRTLRLRSKLQLI